MTAPGDPPSETPLPTSPERLESWKEIASYLRRDVRTVQRWEKHAGLPVHRHPSDKVGAVFAFRSELDAWRNNGAGQAAWAQTAAVSDAPSGLLGPTSARWKSKWTYAVAGAAGALVAFLALWLLSANAPASGRPTLTVRRVFEGPDAYILSGPSPDGRYFGFIYHTMDVGIRDMHSFETRRITTTGTGFFSKRREAPEGMRFSPDGREVAYVWIGRSHPELRVSGIDGSGPRILISDPSYQRMRVGEWSRDGKWILLVLRQKEENLIALVASDSGQVSVVRRTGNIVPDDVSLSADGRFVVHDWPDPQKNKSDIHFVAADGSRDGPLIQHPANDVQPVWTPEGRHMLFFSDRSGTMDIWLQRVEKASPVGEPVLVKRNAGNVMVMGFDREGSFYYGNQFTRADAMIAPLDSEERGANSSFPANPERLGTTASPGWSRNGKFLAYVAMQAPSDPGTRNFAVNKLALVVRDVEAGTEREIARAGGRVGGPRWMPDGTILIADGDPAKKEAVISRIDPRTGKSSVFARTGGSFWIQAIEISPDGRRVFYRQGLTLFEYDVRTQKSRKIFNPVFAHAVSPDGRTLAVGHDQSLKLLPVHGGQPRDLWTLRQPERIQTLAWSRDGKTLLAGKSTTAPHVSHTELWIVPLDGSAPQKHGLTINGRMRDLSVDSSYNRIAFTYENIGYEIWALENFLPRRSFLQRMLGE